ncbi:hypothetical protein [Burkholderia stagnalis]|uniref:hypothetical protein n=1 Tax=Burkholderia stagnalis TaxID=1503054 RepID=UPI000F7FB10D|nr:hypothetical protein [Burkholderia stagnalis]
MKTLQCKKWHLILPVLSMTLLAMASTRALAWDVPTVVFPDLVRQATRPDGFVPPGWKIELLTKGDLTGAKRDDLVMILRQNDPRNIVTHDGMCENPLDTNPRILAVAFARPDGGYALALENHTLIPRRESPCLEDVLAEGGVWIERQALKLGLHRFASAGTWEMGNSAYTFRWRNQRFELVGYDDMSIRRNTGEMSEISINYLIGRVKLSSGNVSEDEPSKVIWVKLASRQRWTPDEIGEGTKFDESLSAILRSAR